MLTASIDTQRTFTKDAIKGHNLFPLALKLLTIKQEWYTTKSGEWPVPNLPKLDEEVTHVINFHERTKEKEVVPSQDTRSTNEFMETALFVLLEDVKMIVETEADLASATDRIFRDIEASWNEGLIALTNEEASTGGVAGDLSQPGVMAPNNQPQMIIRRASTRSTSSSEPTEADEEEEEEEPRNSRRRKRPNHRPWITATLNKWLLLNLQKPYPSEEVKTELGEETGLGKTQVDHWFINARRRQLIRFKSDRKYLLQKVREIEKFDPTWAKNYERDMLRPTRVPSGSGTRVQAPPPPAPLPFYSTPTAMNGFYFPGFPTTSASASSQALPMLPLESAYANMEGYPEQMTAGQSYFFHGLSPEHEMFDPTATAVPSLLRLPDSAQGNLNHDPALGSQ